MSPPALPSPPRPESGLATYLRAIITISPALVVWFFARAFLLPKLQFIWTRAKPDDSSVDWLFKLVSVDAEIVRLVSAGLALILIALEFKVPAWPRHRGLVVSGLAILLHTGVLVIVTGIASLALMAAPMLPLVK